MGMRFASIEDFPEITPDTHRHVVRVEISSPTTTSFDDNGYVSLRVEDGPSGTVLVDLRLDPGRFWRLLQGGQQTWPAFIGPNLERVGKTMENQRVLLPEALSGDTDRDELRDVRKAVREQLPEAWWETWESYDTPRVDNRRQRYTIVRRWVSPDA